MSKTITLHDGLNACQMPNCPNAAQYKVQVQSDSPHASKTRYLCRAHALAIAERRGEVLDEVKK